MGKFPSQPESAAPLRRQAERRLQRARGEQQPPEAQDAPRLLHELEVHQVELEIQNEELHRSHEEMEAMLERYTDLYDFAPIGYFTLDLGGVIRGANLAGAALLELDRSRLIGRSFEALVVPGARGAFGEFLAAVAAHREQGALELELQRGPVHRENLTRFVQIQAAISTSGQEYRIAAIDLTKRRQAEKELLSTIHDLRTFSYSVSHDLRTPLRTINSYATVLLEDFGESLNQEGRRLVQSIAQKAVNMGTLVDDLLRFSSNSMQELAVQPIDMTALSRELTGRLAGEHANRTIEFKVAELPGAVGDRSMIAQVLENLLSNAVKFSRMAAKPVIAVGSVESEQDNTYFVKDNGIGFDVKYVGSIFNVFQRLHGSADYEGAGVGLAIVEQIITKHGGRVWADSKQGKGATFYFTLPRP